MVWRSASRVLRGLLVLILMVVSAGCLGTGDTGAETVAPPERKTLADGPLQMGAAGGFAMTAPERAGIYRDDAWRGTFGGVLPCSTGAKVVLEAVRVVYDEPAPVSASVLFREVERDRDGDEAAPLGSALGGAPDFGESYATEKRMVGRVASLAPGQLVTQQCSQDEDQQFQELLVVIESGPSGSRVGGVQVDYLADGTPLRLELNWELVNCGPAPSLKEFCEP